MAFGVPQSGPGAGRRVDDDLDAAFGLAGDPPDGEAPERDPFDDELNAAFGLNPRSGIRSNPEAMSRVDLGALPGNERVGDAVYEAYRRGDLSEEAYAELAADSTAAGQAAGAMGDAFSQWGQARLTYGLGSPEEMAARAQYMGVRNGGAAPSAQGLDAMLDPSGQAFADRLRALPTDEKAVPRAPVARRDATGTGAEALERVPGTGEYAAAEARRLLAAEEAARLAAAREEAGLTGEAWNALKQVPRQALSTFVGGTGDALAGLSDAVGADGLARYFSEGADQRREAIAGLIPTDADLDLGLPSKGAGAIGSTIPFAVGGAATGSRYLAPAVMGSAFNSGSQYREAVAALEAGGATDSDVLWATVLGGVVGAGEAVPVGRMFSRADRASGGAFRRSFLNVFKEGGEEAAQEWLNAQANDVIARFTHDEGRDFSLRGEEALLGGIGGVGMATVAEGGNLSTGAVRNVRALAKEGAEGRMLDAARTPEGAPTVEEWLAQNPAAQDRLAQGDLAGVRAEYDAEFGLAQDAPETGVARPRTLAEADALREARAEFEAALPNDNGLIATYERDGPEAAFAEFLIDRAAAERPAAPDSATQEGAVAESEVERTRARAQGLAERLVADAPVSDAPGDAPRPRAADSSPAYDPFGAFVGEPVPDAQAGPAPEAAPRQEAEPAPLDAAAPEVVEAPPPFRFSPVEERRLEEARALAADPDVDNFTDEDVAALEVRLEQDARQRAERERQAEIGRKRARAEAIRAEMSDMGALGTQGDSASGPVGGDSAASAQDALPSGDGQSLPSGDSAPSRDSGDGVAVDDVELSVPEFAPPDARPAGDALAPVVEAPAPAPDPLIVPPDTDGYPLPVRGEPRYKVERDDRGDVRVYRLDQTPDPDGGSTFRADERQPPLEVDRRSSNYERAVAKQLVREQPATEGRVASRPLAEQDTYLKEVAEQSDDPAQVVQAYRLALEAEAVDEAGGPIADYFRQNGTVSLDSFVAAHGDPNQEAISRGYFSLEGPDVGDLAMTLSRANDRVGQDSYNAGARNAVEPQQIVDWILAHPSSPLVSTAKSDALAARFEALTGVQMSPRLADLAVEEGLLALAEAGVDRARAEAVTAAMAVAYEDAVGAGYDEPGQVGPWAAVWGLGGFATDAHRAEIEATFQFDPSQYDEFKERVRREAFDEALGGLPEPEPRAQTVGEPVRREPEAPDDGREAGPGAAPGDGAGVEGDRPAAGQPDADGVGPPLADSAAGPTRTFQRGQRGSVVVRFADQTQADLYDYGSRVRVGAQVPTGLGRQRHLDRTAALKASLIASGIPEAELRQRALAEYDHVRAEANAAPDPDGRQASIDLTRAPRPQPADAVTDPRESAPTTDGPSRDADEITAEILPLLDQRDQLEREDRAAFVRDRIDPLRAELAAATEGQEAAMTSEDVPELAPERPTLEGEAVGPLPTVPQAGEAYVYPDDVDPSAESRPVPDADPRFAGMTLGQVEAEVGKEAMGRLMTALGFTHGKHLLNSARVQVSGRSQSALDETLQREGERRSIPFAFPPDPTAADGLWTDYTALPYDAVVSFAKAREAYYERPGNSQKEQDKIPSARRAAANNPDTPRFSLEEGADATLTPDQTAAVLGAVEGMANVLGDVTALGSVDLLPDELQGPVRAQIDAGFAVPGVYTSDGVYVLVDQIGRAAKARGERPEDTARRTVLHEVVAHEGLAEILGGQYAPTMEAIFRHVGMKRLRETGVFDRYADQFGLGDGKTLTSAQRVGLAEEFLGYLAGQHTKLEPSVWQRVRNVLARALRRFFPQGAVEADLTRLLWATNQYLQAKTAAGQTRPETVYSRVRTIRDRQSPQADSDASAEDVIGMPEMDRATASRWQRAFDEARALDLVQEANGIVWRVTLQGAGKDLTDAERAALVLEATRLRSLREEKLAQLEGLVEKGDPGVVVAQADLAAIGRKLQGVASAYRQAAGEAADPLGLGTIDLASSAHTEETVLREAIAMKGAPLTPEERTAVMEKYAELKEADAQVEALASEARRARAEAARAAAEAKVDTARRARKRAEEKAAASEKARAEMEARQEELLREREEIRNDLRRLGLRVNDVTGVTVEGAYHVGRLALNVAKSGYYTLDEVVREVQRQLPDKSADEVILALAEKKRDADKSEAELRKARVRQRRAQRAVREAQHSLAPKSKMDRGIEALNIFRTLMATLDISGTLRQGAILIPSRPIAAAGAFWNAVQAALSSTKAEEIDYALRTDPRQFKREAAGLFLAPMGNGSSLLEREESFISRWVQNLRVLGAPVRMAERHMLVLLNLLRASAFDNFADNNPDATTEQLRSYAQWVNYASGRGGLGDFTMAGQKLATVFFSPRFAVSRFQVPYKVLKSVADLRDADKRDVSLEVIKDFSAWFLTVTGALSIAAAAGDDEDDRIVGLTPRDSDFGKLIVGTLRYDPWSGTGQVARLLGRTALVFTDRQGITEKPRDDRDQDPYDLAARFIKYKASPQVGLVLWGITGKDALGEEQTATQAAYRSLLPLGITETAETYAANKDTERAMSYPAAVFLGNFFGLGVSAYDDPLEDSRVQPIFERAQYAPRPGKADKDAFKAELYDLVLRQRGALMEMDDETLDQALRRMADEARNTVGRAEPDADEVDDE